MKIRLFWLRDGSSFLPLDECMLLLTFAVFICLCHLLICLIDLQKTKVDSSNDSELGVIFFSIIIMAPKK